MQKRGFWLCNYCETPFDCFEEAHAHETFECPHQLGTPSLDNDRQQQLHRMAPYPAEHLPSTNIEEESCHAVSSECVMTPDGINVRQRQEILEEWDSASEGQKPQHLSSEAPTLQRVSMPVQKGFEEQGHYVRHSFPPHYEQHPGALPRGPVDRLEPVPVYHASSLPHDQKSDSPTRSPFDFRSDFPFFQIPSGDWICKYCCNVPPEYRNPYFVWSTPGKAPPTPSFVDCHLGQCLEYARASQAFDHASQGSRCMDVLLPGSKLQGAAGTWFETNYSPYAEYSGSNRRGNGSFPADLPESDPESACKRSIEHLEATDNSHLDVHGNRLPEDSMLVLEEDRLLLTDYFYFLMKQLRLVRFSEADRRTRGGKRENIAVGYGGLQCVHCAQASNARKFFWSNVDRLANSFAEIPAHIMKCKKCPQPTKEALLQLKQKHPEQMARLPRGSQKVFFRRMWRRLHDNDPENEKSDDPLRLQIGQNETEDSKLAARGMSPDRTLGSEESVLMQERPASAGAETLANAAMDSNPPSPSSRVLLAIPEDKEWLSDTDCFVRKQIEVFCATSDDVNNARIDQKLTIHKGQVGIRCVHCALTSGARFDGVAYPVTIAGMYESVREFQRLHLDECTNVPPSVKTKLQGLKGASSLSSVLRKYYVLAAGALGLKDTHGSGIRAGGKIKKISAFSVSVADSQTLLESSVASTKRKASDCQPNLHDTSPSKSWRTDGA